MLIQCVICTTQNVRKRHSPPCSVAADDERCGAVPDPQEQIAAALTREQHNSLQAALFDSPATVESFMEPLLMLDVSSQKARIACAGNIICHAWCHPATRQSL